MNDLRKRRLNLGLSGREAARQIGVPPDALTRAERGQGQPHPRNAKLIADFYGLKVTDIWPLEPVREASAA